MSLQWQLSREIPEDTATLGRLLLAAENIYRQIGDRFNDLFPEEDIFASMYDSGGRGAISPLLLALVTVFQMMEKVPDRLAAEWVVSRIDWKYALHLPLTYTGFHFTDLLAFRQRLLEHDQDRLIFDQFLLKLRSLGLIKGRGKIRTDSTHVLAVVERLSQFELVAEGLRVALRAATKVAAEWAEQALPATFREAYSQRQSEYGLSKEQVRERLMQTGQDAFWFLAQVDRCAPESVRQLPEVETLRAILQQQFPGGPGEPPATKRPTGKGVIESPHEPEVCFATKRGKGWQGYKAQVSETCDPDTPHLIVDLEPTGALDNDSPETPRIQARLKERQIVPKEQYVDRGYMSGDNLTDSAKRGINLMGVPLEDTRGPSGFRQESFDFDSETRQATCPAEHVSVVWSERQDAQGQTRIQIRFDGRLCQQCRFFGHCTSSLQGRSLTLHPHRSALIQRRAEARTEAFQEKMHIRAGIEGTISELVRGFGLRQARYRGRKKLRLQTYFTAAAANLKRVARWWAKSGLIRATAG